MIFMGQVTVNLKKKKNFSCFHPRPESSEFQSDSHLQPVLGAHFNLQKNILSIRLFARKFAGFRS